MPIKREKPDIFEFHDYREFLRGLFTFFKKTRTGFTVARLAKSAQVSDSLLSMVVKGKANLTDKAFQKILPFLELAPTEQTYLKLLCIIANSQSQEERLNAIEQLQKLSGYKKLHPKETEVYQYLTNIHYVTIRELSALEGFRLDPDWIQRHLWYDISRSEIEKAIEFLVRHKFIEVAPDGRVSPPSKSLECMDQIYKAAMAKYHREIFSLASKAFDKVEYDQKSITGYTMAISAHRFQEVKAIFSQTLNQLVALAEKEKHPNTVFQISFMGFPLSKPLMRDEKQ